MKKNEIIRRRKSVRKFNPAKLDAAELEKVQAKIAGVKPLYPDIRFSIEFAEKTKGFFGIKAPHYLLFNSEIKEGAYENVGFIGQQLDLFFSQAGLGSCWLGISKPVEQEVGAEPFIICLAFGKPAEPLHREYSQFNRKPLDKMSEGTDERLEAARLAPSGMNAQNWHFIAEDGKIHCYCKTAGPLLKSFMSKLSRIDIGIALCHIAEESDNFRFAKEANAPERKKCLYVGTVL